MPRTISTMTMAGLLAGALALGSSISTDGAQSKTPAAQQATPPASQQVAPAGEVAFLDTAFPVMSVGTDGHLRAIVYVKNTTKVDDKGTVALNLRSAAGTPVKTTLVSKNEVVIPLGGQPLPIEIDADLSSAPPDHYPMSGWLSLKTAADTKTLAISTIDRRNDGAEWPQLRDSFFLALVPVVLVALWFLVSDARVLVLRMGTPGFTFTESWSSTLTIAGAILTTFLTFTGLPDYGHIMSKKTYTIASLLFAALIMLAPGVYALFRRTTQVKNETGTKTPQTQGLVLLFLAAAVLTTTGVLAQFKLLGALFSDLGSAGIVSIDTARTFRNICVVLQPVLIVYTGVSVYLTIREQAAFEVADTSQRAKYSAEAADAAVRGDKAGEAEATAAAAVPAMRPGWQLL